MLAVAVMAEAQQPKKVPRIGYLGAASQSRDKGLLEIWIFGFPTVAGAID
jgi:hypothetical protein